mgnify:CR=1 FL=1
MRQQLHRQRDHLVVQQQVEAMPLLQREEEGGVRLRLAASVHEGCEIWGDMGRYGIGARGLRAQWWSVSTVE